MCQVSQDVFPGCQRGVAGLVVSGKRDKRQEEVEENGDEGQGQTDCPGATAHTPHHRCAERRVRRRRNCGVKDFLQTCSEDMSKAIWRGAIKAN